LTILFIVAIDGLLSYYKPLKHFNNFGFTPLDLNPLVAKLPEFMHQTNSPDLLMLGSSLVVVPAVRCDDELNNRRARYDREFRRTYLNGYNKAEYLQKLLSENRHQQIKIANLGVIASMMSDHQLILEKTLGSGKKPKLVVCCLAPRDFLDNYRAQVESTPVYQVLADAQFLQDLLARHAKLDEILSYATGLIWHYYQVRADYKSVAVGQTAAFFDRPTSLFMAAFAADEKKDHVNGNPTNAELVKAKIEKTPDYDVPPNTLDDINTYKNVYLPVNDKCFETQRTYLEKLLKQCQDTHTPILIVNMPLTKQNKEILPPELWTRYFATVKGLCTKYGANYYDADQTDYTLADFEDSCHMNAQGGKKFYKAVLEPISKNLKL
jgi:hypothetical protein